jgi:RHS repeat-associated protein
LIYRLTNETITADPASMNGAVSYVYDAVGNRTQKTSTLPGYPGGLSSYNANDELASDTYDADGNTTVSQGFGYVYDFENHLVQAGAGITYVYDGDGYRVQKIVAGVLTKYLVVENNPTGYAQVGGEELPNGYPVVTYVYGLEQISRTDQNAGVTKYYVHDGHGSVRVLTDVNGTVTDTYDYDAFGNLIHSTGSSPNNYLFAGEQFDPDLNLYYNRARYLSTSTGRFWTMDANEGADQDPRSLHKYFYAFSNPVNLADPSGKTPLTDFVAKLAKAGVQVSARFYGTLAHARIENDILAEYPLALLELPVPGGEIDVLIPQGGLYHLYEIKPLDGTVDPQNQIDRYIAALPVIGSSRVIPGELQFSNTIRGPFLIDKIQYETSGPGVITYEPYVDSPRPPTLTPIPISTILTLAVLTTVLVGVLIAAEAF